MSTGNAKHQAAVELSAQIVQQLRVDVIVQLERLVVLAKGLEELTDTRQTVGLGFQTAETRAAQAKQDAADRRAARVSASDVADGIQGVDWMRAAALRPTGPIQAPVTMPPTSALAEIIFTLRQHMQKIAKAGRMVAQEYEQIDEEDHGICVWPRRRILQLRVDPNAGVAHLAAHLAALVEGYTNRKRLEAMLRDLEHLEEVASDVIDGPAKTNHSDPCPWCGRHSLIVHHRTPGRAEAWIRCEGHHVCECTEDDCPDGCHRDPRRNRHEWRNSGRAGRHWFNLQALQQDRKEAARVEYVNTEAVARIRELHSPVNIYDWAEKCTKPDDHAEQHITYESGDTACEACPPVGTYCAHCSGEDRYVAYPCLTIHALEPAAHTDHYVSKEK